MKIVEYVTLPSSKNNTPMTFPCPFHKTGIVYTPSPSYGDLKKSCDCEIVWRPGLPPGYMFFMIIRQTGTSSQK